MRKTLQDRFKWGAPGEINSALAFSLNGHFENNEKCDFRYWLCTIVFLQLVIIKHKDKLSCALPCRFLSYLSCSGTPVNEVWDRHPFTLTFTLSLSGNNYNISVNVKLDQLNSCVWNKLNVMIPNEFVFRIKPKRNKEECRQWGCQPKILDKIPL